MLICEIDHILNSPKCTGGPGEEEGQRTKRSLCMSTVLKTTCILLILTLVIVASVFGNESSAYRIRGVVINMESGGPVKLAEVFVSGTTYGSITNEAGEFELETSYLPCQLVVSHIAYASFTQLINLESLHYVTVKLIPYEHEIKEITVEGKSMRKENLALFREAFIGTDEIASACRILNDSCETVSICAFRFSLAGSK